MAYSDHVGWTDERADGSSWQPVWPTSRRERARYRGGQFTPLIGSLPDDAPGFGAASSSPVDAASPKSRPAETTPTDAAPPKTVHRGRTKPRALGSAGTVAGSGAGWRASSTKASRKAAPPAGQTPTVDRPASAHPAQRASAAPAPTGRDSATNGTGNAVAAAIMGALAIVLAPSSAVLAIALAVIAFAQASKARKLGRKVGVGRVLASVGIVLSLLSIFAGGNGLADLIDDALDGPSYLQAPESYRYATDTTDDMIDALDLDGAELRVAELADQQFGKLSNPDEETLRTVAGLLDGDLQESFGVSHADLGIDPLDAARWAMAGSTYSIGSVYAFDDGDGDAFADVRVPNTDALYDALLNARYGNGASSSTADAATLSRMADAYRAVLQQPATEMDDRFVDVEFDLVDGEWTVDQAYWESTLRNLYGL